MTTLTGVLTAIGSIAGIVGAGYGIFKFVAWAFVTPEAQTDAKTDAQAQADKQAAETTGRPV